MTARKREPAPKALALAKLQTSGLTVEDARRAHLEALSAAQVVKLSPTFKAYPALKLPYHDMRGRRTGFYRLRYLGELNGFDALRKKAPRYVQAPDTTVEVYLPPYVDWPKLAADPGVSVLVTEGELKALASAKCGFPTLGLGGVWSWRSAKKGVEFVETLARFRWEGRAVYVVFDSDAATKPDVARALHALAEQLTGRGARPYVVRLPVVTDEAGAVVTGKVGLDDFLLAKGKDALAALLTETEPYSAAAELWRLNGEVVYIRDPGLVIVLADGRKLAPKAFKEHAYANRYYVEHGFDAKGQPRLTKKPAATAWLAWEQRSELAQLTYAPGQPRVTVGGAYNYWPGWACEPRRGDVRLWQDLLAYLFGTDPERAHREWFERWLAYPLQHPGTKLYSAAVLWGATQGTGKSLIGYTMARVYGANFVEINDEDLGGSFNEWAQHKQFVLADDVTGAEYKKALMDRLKGMITRQRLRINAKYVPTYELPDCLNYYFTSQHPDAFMIDDTDRRYFVHEAPDVPQPDAWYRAYDAWYKSPEGTAALFHHLLHLDLRGFDPNRSPPVTAAKRAMIADSKSDLGAWVARLKENADQLLRVGTVALRSDLYTNEQLLALYDPSAARRVTANGMGRELKKAGFRQAHGGAVVATARGPQRLYVVRNPGRWAHARPADLGAHYDEAHGAGEAKKEKWF